jgi:hypothetical protein
MYFLWPFEILYELEKVDMYILWPFEIFYGHLGYFMTIWHIVCSFGTFFRFWCHAPIKIWQPWFGDILAIKKTFLVTLRVNDMVR